MKLKDITLAYCKRNNLILYDGKMGEDDPAPILPFLIMDCAYQEFCREIKPIAMHHESKRSKNAWLADYRVFNHRLFSCLDEGLRDFAIDKMDEYEAFVGNDVFRIKIAVMNLVKGCSLEDQKIIGSLMTCNILSQVAQITWGLVYRTGNRQKEKCPELTRMRTTSHHLCNCVAILAEDIHPNEDKNLNNAVDAFMSRTTAWTKTQRNDRER